MPPLTPDQLPENWSAVASSYSRAFEQLTAQFAAEALARLKVAPGERVLDVAAGTGAFSLLAARAGAVVLATDFAPGMVAHLRQRAAAAGLANFTAEVMDGQALAVPDASCDVSASVLGLIFFPDIPKGLAELRRVLRPGGRTAIVCWADPERLALTGIVRRAVAAALPDFELPTATPVAARLAGIDSLRTHMKEAHYRRVEVVSVTKPLRIESPETFWVDFTSAAPPMAALVARLGPERTAAVGRAYVELLKETLEDGVPTLYLNACIGIGWV